MKKISFLIMGLAIYMPQPVWAEQTPLSLKTVLQRTQANHPSLQLYKEKAAVIEANRLQAGLSPNPELSFSLENAFGNNEAKDVSGIEGTLLISQLFERGDKKQRRIAMQDSKLVQFQTEYQLTQLDVFADATAQYYQVMRLQSLLALSQTQQSTVSDALNTIKQRAAAGAVSNADVARMQFEHGTLQLEQQQLESEFTTAKLHLAQFWLDEADFSNVLELLPIRRHTNGNLKTELTLPNLADLHNAIDMAPEIQLISQQVLSEQAAMQLASANSVADLTLGTGVRFDNASNSASLLFEAAMPLQLSNSQQGNIKAASAQINLLSEQQQLIRQSLKQQISQTYTLAQNQQRRLLQLQSQLLPLAKTLISQSLDSYRLGQISVLQLLDAQKERFNTEQAIIDTQVALLNSHLMLQRLIGNTSLSALNNAHSQSPLSNQTATSSPWSNTL
ncbi:TolC family protein [Pseudoalteromonas phenolica]|uniref:Metal transporter n=1 Tax=Pseudoalteromonas phenolica TaxID=161398 RepID=A0A0S2K827_9GAMM|nr:TolC family protein [Pseudoalteromonas phenolica]ALO44470.1 metal transporter [Pseudoalteromonas phenolica]